MTKTTVLTAADRAKISAYLTARHISAGIGTKEEPCSVAAINLALTGKLTDKIPDCMSIVIGRWIIRVQDYMPDSMRNSDEWRYLLPFAADTGRDHERERRAIILDWTFGVVLPHLQPLADKRGYGEVWRAMCEKRTPKAAQEARAAAAAAADAAATAYDAAYAADAAAAAYDAAYAADDADAAAAYAADAAAYDAAYDAAYAAAADGDAAAYAADAATAAAAAARVTAWAAFNTIALLRKLVEVSEKLP